jgi:hypothetical protein
MSFKLKSVLVMLILVSFTGFSQQKFLFDANHAETAGNADWVICENSNGTTIYSIPTPAQSGITSSTSETYWTGALSSWGVALVKLGYYVETLPPGTSITFGTNATQDLKNYNVFVIDEPNTVFTTAEKKALINFVANGGGLFMISDHTGSDRNNDGWDSPMIWNDLFTNNGIVSNPFGLSVDLTNISQTSTNVLTGDSIIAGPAGTVTGMQWSNGATITVNNTANPTAKNVVWTTGTAHGLTNGMVARAFYGKGRVVLVSDSSPADDGSGASGNTLYVGWAYTGTGVNGSHAYLHLNGSIWLANITALPIELTSFTSSVTGNNVNLKWNTATEVNSYIFEIEKKDAGQIAGWEKIGTIKAAGNSSAPKNYSYSDNNILTGKFNYRLKMVDVDGSYHYSNVVNTDVGSPAKFELGNAYPNPWNPTTTIRYSVPVSSPVTIKVFDAIGREVSTLVDEVKPAGSYQITMNDKGLSSGMYFYRMTAGNFSETKKLILIK